jgi:hypothetical protein
MSLWVVVGGQYGSEGMGLRSCPVHVDARVGQLEISLSMVLRRRQNNL